MIREHRAAIARGVIHGLALSTLVLIAKWPRGGGGGGGGGGKEPVAPPSPMPSPLVLVHDEEPVPDYVPDDWTEHEDVA